MLKKMLSCFPRQHECKNESNWHFLEHFCGFQTLPHAPCSCRAFYNIKYTCRECYKTHIIHYTRVSIKATFSSLLRESKEGSLRKRVDAFRGEIWCSIFTYIKSKYLCIVSSGTSAISWIVRHQLPF